MNGRHLRRGIVVVGLGGLVAAGCAQEMQKASPAESVAQRQRLMKLHGALWKDIQDKAKADNIEGIAVSAEALALNAPRIPSLFPEGSLTDKSKAKPDVWQKWSEFEQAAKNLETESAKLRDAAAAKDGTTTQAIVKDFGGKACGTCHRPFRVPPPRTG